MRIVVFILLLLTWMMFSGKTDIHFIYGLISCAIVTFFSGDLLFQDSGKSSGFYFRQVFLIPIYGLWLLKEIIVANFHVLRLSFHPRMAELIHPSVIVFKASELDNDFARVVLANSITLTPGTVTMRLDGDVFTVHALDRVVAGGLPEPMLSRVAQTFNISSSSGSSGKEGE